MSTMKLAIDTVRVISFFAAVFVMASGVPVSAVALEANENADVKACFGKQRSSTRDGLTFSTLKRLNAQQNVKDKETCAHPAPEPVTNGGYPATWANAPAYSMVDAWGYYNRTSTSYAAFKVVQSGGVPPYNFGAANQWPARAYANGISVGSTPYVGDVAIVMAGAYGHAMYVERVNPDGSIQVSQYDYGASGVYSEMTISAMSAAYFIHFPRGV